MVCHINVSSIHWLIGFLGGLWRWLCLHHTRGRNDEVVEYLAANNGAEADGALRNEQGDHADHQVRRGRADGHDSRPGNIV